MRTRSGFNRVPKITSEELMLLLQNGASMQLMIAAARVDGPHVIELLTQKGVLLQRNYCFQYRRSERQEILKLLRSWYEDGATVSELMTLTAISYPALKILLDEAGTTMRRPGANGPNPH
jgi:hypothetical protein